MARVSEETMKRAQALIDASEIVRGSLLAWKRGGPPTMLVIEHKTADKTVVGFLKSEDIDPRMRLWERNERNELSIRYVLVGQMPEGCTHRLLLRPPGATGAKKSMAYRNGIRAHLGRSDLVEAYGVEFWKVASVERAVAQFQEPKTRLAG